MTPRTIKYVDQEKQDIFSCKHENTWKSMEFSEGDEQLCLLTVFSTVIFQIGKKSPKFQWKWDLISARDTRKKSLAGLLSLSNETLNCSPVFIDKS